MDKNEKKGIFTIGSVDTFVEQRNQGLEELYENLQAFNSAIETDFGGKGTGTCPNLKNQRFAYLFPHPVLSWEGLY